ncbi:hypothetical protein P4S72_15155 [Vibrio sp. PP-XX7]
MQKLVFERDFMGTDAFISSFLTSFLTGTDTFISLFGLTNFTGTDTEVSPEI